MDVVQEPLGRVWDVGEGRRGHGAESHLDAMAGARLSSGGGCVLADTVLGFDVEKTLRAFSSPLPSGLAALSAAAMAFDPSTKIQSEKEKCSAAASPMAFRFRSTHQDPIREGELFDLPEMKRWLPPACDASCDVLGNLSTAGWATPRNSGLSNPVFYLFCSFFFPSFIRVMLFCLLLHIFCIINRYYQYLF